MSHHPALLPTGLRDLLPPDSTREFDLVHTLIGLVAAHGYDLVKPPLVEFEQALLSGLGQALSRQTFRLMDPLSQQMMAVRADTTMQIARIAASRLQNEPRPLRLAYCGEVLRVSGTQLFPERQFCQLGAELIGSDCAVADAEMIVLAASCMKAAGIAGVSIDLSLPALLAQLSPDPALAEAVERRDLTAIHRLDKSLAPLLEKLVALSGPADQALRIMAAIGLPREVQTQFDRLRETVDLIHRAAPEIVLTLDPLERRGFEYHTALSFTLFVVGHGEIGRGGRYVANDGEPATGFTFLVDNLLTVLPVATSPARVYLPLGTPVSVVQDLQDQGLRTIGALDNNGDAKAEAKRMKCTHYWDGAALAPVEE